jgi:hypothetical protein
LTHPEPPPPTPIRPRPPNHRRRPRFRPAARQTPRLPPPTLGTRRHRHHDRRSNAHASGPIRTDTHTNPDKTTCPETLS